MNKNRNQPITEGFSGFFSMLIGGALMVILVVSFKPPKGPSGGNLKTYRTG